MISDEVIQSCGLLLVLLGLEFDLFGLSFVDFIPFRLKIRPVEELSLLNTNLRCEHWRISSNSQLNIDFSHIPLEGVF